MLNKLLGVLFLINFVNSNGANMDYIRSPADKGKNNVTCIAHDTKITCDCGYIDEKMVLRPLYGNSYQVSVTNCKWLSISSYALSHIHGLRSVRFTNVENLILQENSLYLPKSNTPLLLEFNKFTVKEIQPHAINGNIEEIVFTSGKIATIRPFAFTSLKDRARLLMFSFVQIDKIEPQAFKKFSIDHVEFCNSTITSGLPSKSLYEVEILHHLKIHNTTFKEVHSKAFSFKGVSKVVLSDNCFKKVHGEWMEASVLDYVIIKNNHFEQIESSLIFKGISVHKVFKLGETIELQFKNNTLHYQKEIFPLEFDNKFQLIVKDLCYVNVINCPLADKIGAQNFFKTFSDTVYFKHEEQEGKFITLKKILKEGCVKPPYWIYIWTGAVLLILILLILASILIYIYIKRHKNKLDLVIPEPRTYRETQIVVQIENAGLIKTDL